MRHFIVCLIISAMFPGVGGLCCLFGGWLWEYLVPSEDKEQDLENNIKGITYGSLIGLIIFVCFWLPLFRR